MRGIKDIVLLLSTDCFAGCLFSDIPEAHLEKLRDLSRKTAKRILKGVEDYWQDTRDKEEDEAFFFQELERANTGKMILQRIFLFQIIITKDEAGEKAFHLIRSASSQLRCLAIERFAVPITDEIIAAVVDIQDENFLVDACMRTPYEYDADRAWEISCARSSWDKHIVNVMETLPDYLPNVFDDIFYAPISMDYLWCWKKHLPHKKFSVLLKAIEKEALSRTEENDTQTMVMELLTPLQDVV